MSHTLALEAPTRFVGNDYIFGGYFRLAPHLGIEIIERRTDLFLHGARARQYQGCGDVAYRAVLG